MRVLCTSFIRLMYFLSRFFSYWWPLSHKSSWSGFNVWNSFWVSGRLFLLSPQAVLAQDDGVWQCGSCHPMSSPEGNCTPGCNCICINLAPSSTSVFHYLRATESEPDKAALNPTVNFAGHWPLTLQPFASLFHSPFPDYFSYLSQWAN